MAFGRSKPASAAVTNEAEIEAPRFSVDGPIPRLDDLPEVAKELALLRLFGDERRKRERQIEILVLRYELSAARTTQEGAPKPGRVKELTARLDALQSTTPVPVAIDVQRNGEHGDIARALAIIDRVPAPKMLTSDELRQEIAAIRKAEIVVTQRLEGVRGTANYEMHLALQEKQKTLAVAVYQAAVALSEAVAAERQFDADLIALGYTTRGEIFVWPTLPSAYQMGSLANRNSQITECWRRLIERGIDV